MNHECNIFNGVYDQDCSNVVKILSVLKNIRNGRWKEQVLQIREAYSKGKKKEVSNLKFSLPAVTWSGVFEERLDDACVVYNELMVIDIDNINKTRLKRLKEELKLNPWIFAYFDGPSKGIKILVFVDAPIEWHNTHTFWTIESLFMELYGVEIDRSGKNPSRLCFVSYDPSLWISPNAEYLKIEEVEDPLNGFRSLKSQDFENGVPSTDASYILERVLKMVRKSKTGNYHKGNRNNFIFVASCLMCEYGVNPDQTLSLLASRYQSLKYAEVKNTVASAYKRCRNKFATQQMMQYKSKNQNSLL